MSILMLTKRRHVTLIHVKFLPTVSTTPSPPPTKPPLPSHQKTDPNADESASVKGLFVKRIRGPYDQARPRTWPCRGYRWILLLSWAAGRNWKR